MAETYEGQAFLDASELAHYIVTYAYEHHKGVTNWSLNCIMYDMFVATLAMKGRPLFADIMKAYPTTIQVPAIYYEYCCFGAMPIMERYSDMLNGVSQEDTYALNHYLDNMITMNPWELHARVKPKNGAHERLYGRVTKEDAQKHDFPIASLPYIRLDVPLLYGKEVQNNREIGQMIDSYTNQISDISAKILYVSQCVENLGEAKVHRLSSKRASDVKYDLDKARTALDLAKADLSRLKESLDAVEVL